MMRPALSALALGVLAAVGLAANAAAFSPDTGTFSNIQTEATNTPVAGTSSTSVAASTAAPAAATTPIAADETGAASAASGMPASHAPIAMPTRGMLMNDVARKFGEPEQKLPAVPDPGTKVHPPITRWVYPQYVVYFEYNYVVHSVLKAHPFSNHTSD